MNEGKAYEIVLQINAGTLSVETHVVEMTMHKNTEDQEL